MNAAILRVPASPRRAGSQFARWLVRLATVRAVMPHRLGIFDLARSEVAREAMKAIRR